MGRVGRVGQVSQVRRRGSGDRSDPTYQTHLTTVHLLILGADSATRARAGTGPPLDLEQLAALQRRVMARRNLRRCDLTVGAVVLELERDDPRDVRLECQGRQVEVQLFVRQQPSAAVIV